MMSLLVFLAVYSVIRAIRGSDPFWRVAAVVNAVAL
jgi:hypothetical protein